MNHLVHGGLTALELAERPNQRALAKQRTREKIIGAAKLLFAERGYEGATDPRHRQGGRHVDRRGVRQLHRQVRPVHRYRRDRAGPALRRDARAAEGLSGRAAILAMLDAAAERQLGVLALFQAIMSALWTPGLGRRRCVAGWIAARPPR